MRKVTAFKALAVAGAMALAGLSAGPAMAANPVVVGSKLTGATGVVVGGTTYDVEFVDGTCATVFSGCTSTSNFNFQSSADATAAANALFAQVLQGAYDTNPAATFGCTNDTVCAVLIPYLLSGSTISYINASNQVAQNVVSAGTTSFPGDTAGQSAQVWARFSLAATAVPEPASWAMMLLGFAGIGLAARRRRAQAWSPAA